MDNWIWVIAALIAVGASVVGFYKGLSEVKESNKPWCSLIAYGLIPVFQSF